MKKLCLLSILTLVIFSGCSAKDITINKVKNDSDINQTAVIEASDEPSSKETDEAKDSVTNSDVDNSNETINIHPKMGERFLAETMVGSGEFYATVNSAQIFYNLNDSGIKQDELLPYSLLIDGEPRIEYDVEIFDKASGDMLNGWGIVKLHMTVENVNGISLASVDFDEYDEDMFRADIFSVCNADNSSMINPINHRTYAEIYFSKSGENDIHPLAYTCRKGETVEYDIAYIFNCKPEYLAFSVSTGNKMDTMVYLELTE